MKGRNTAVFAGCLILFTAAFFYLQALFTEHMNYLMPFVGYGGTFQLREIGGSIPAWYKMAFVLGGVMVTYLITIRRNRYGISLGKSILVSGVTVLVGYTGAKLMYVLENFAKIREEGFTLTFGGLSLFGAVFLIPMVFLILSPFLGQTWGTIMDLCAPAGAVMFACMRIGCFIKGCCHSPVVWWKDRPVIFPVQLLESSLDLFLLSLLLTMEALEKNEKRRYAVFLIGYGSLRFVLEFLRETPKEYLFFSKGQCWAMVSVVIGCTIFCLERCGRVM